MSLFRCASQTWLTYVLWADAKRGIHGSGSLYHEHITCWAAALRGGLLADRLVARTSLIEVVVRLNVLAQVHHITGFQGHGLFQNNRGALVVVALVVLVRLGGIGRVA